MTRQLVHRVGRRGASLLFFALVDLVYGIPMAADPHSLLANASYAFLATILPLQVWAIPWVVVGLLCALQAFATNDRPAFIAASWLKVGWGTLHLTGWLIGEIPRGYVSAVIWYAFAGFVAVISTWREHSRRP